MLLFGGRGTLDLSIFKIVATALNVNDKKCVCIFVHLQKELPNKKDCPHMCAYKLVTVKFKWWGLQNKVENFIQKVCGVYASLSLYDHYDIQVATFQG